MSTPKSTSPHVAKALQYCKDVVKGKVIASQLVKAACSRHLRDLEQQKSKGFAYVFDSKLAERACRFIELLPHVKGEWARVRPGHSNLIVLEAWQCFIVCSIFGWRRKSDGRRRFRIVYIEVPRKNAKSDLAADIGLYLFAADDEPGAEVYSGATSEKQAWEVFGPARKKALACPQLCAHFGIEVNASNIAIVGNGSKFEPIIGKPGDGASPSCAIIDEYHEHQTPDQFNTMQTGMGARSQPLMFVITTAGDNIAGPCYQLRSIVVRVLEGAVEDDEMFGIIYGLDPDDDWTTRQALIKANPNFGVSIDEGFLMTQQRRAIENTALQGTFLTKHLNVWLQAKNAYFNMKAWGDCADENASWLDYQGNDTWLALDLASKTDIAALEGLIDLGDGSFFEFGRYYLPEATIEKPENVHYQGWHRAGHLIATPGNIIDFEFIERDILEVCAGLRVVDICYDPFQATMLVTRLQSNGLPLTQYGQTVRNMSEPMKTLSAMIDARKLRHANNPVMNWMMANVVAKVDAKENVYPRKNRVEDKIDGPTALIMAQGRWLVMQGSDAQAGSIYDDPNNVIF